MKRSISKITFLALGMAILVTLSLAQQTNRVGAVNSAEVLQKSTEGKNILSRLDEKNKADQTKLSNMDEDIRQMENKLTTQRLTLTNEALMNMSSDLEKKRTDRKRFAEDSSREFTELQTRLFDKLQSEVMPIIEQIGKEMNLEIIFDLGSARSGVIYVNPMVDLTAELIKRYDASKAPTKK
jgi:Skp family chaperone for outer membrane proteins